MTIGSDKPLKAASNNPRPAFNYCTGKARKKRSRPATKDNETSASAVASTSSVNNTPQKAKSSHSSSAQYSGYSVSDVSKFRREQMESEVVHRLLKDVDCVVAQAQPTDPARRALAGRIASEVAADIEELIEKAGHGTDAHGANSRHDALASADGAFS
ncbi:hypothetical protein EDC05_002416, partial [Coemansia umbellata]